MNKIDELLDAAFMAFNANDLRRAETLCREAMAISPTHGDALYLLGLIAYRQKAWTVAADLLHEALELYPDIRNYQLAFAEVLRVQGYLDEALSYYIKWIDDPKVRTEAGLIYLTQGNKKKAKECFQKALKENENIAAAYLGLAALGGQKKEQEALLLKAYSAESTENTGYHLARFYVRQKAWKKAETIIKNYLVFSRDWTLYAGILESLKRPEEALHALEMAIELDHYNASAWMQQGLLLEHQKKWEQAQISYEKALSLDKDLMVAHNGLSNVLMVQGKFPVALEHTRYIIQKNPNHFPSLYKLGILLEETKDFEEALGIYFKLLTLKKNHKAISKRIQSSILELAHKKKHLARKFAKGWMTSFPDSELAKKTWDLLKVMTVVIALLFSFGAYASFNEEQDALMWEMHYASLGDAASQFKMGQIWEKGEGVPQSMEKAVEYYQKSAAQGYIDANMRLAHLYEEKGEKEQAQRYYLAAAQKGFVPAQFIVSRYFQAQKDYVQAEIWLKQALQQIFPAATDLTLISPEYQQLKREMSGVQSE